MKRNISYVFLLLVAATVFMFSACKNAQPENGNEKAAVTTEDTTRCHEGSGMGVLVEVDTVVNSEEIDKTDFQWQVTVIVTKTQPSPAAMKDAFVSLHCDQVYAGQTDANGRIVFGGGGECPCTGDREIVVFKEGECAKRITVSGGCGRTYRVFCP